MKDSAVRQVRSILFATLALTELGSASGCAQRTQQARVGTGNGSIHQLVFNVVESGDLKRSKATDSQIVVVMGKRLAAARIRAYAFASRDAAIHVTIYDTSEVSYAAKVLSANGNVVLRIQPSGPAYNAPSGRPFSGAQFVFFPGGNRIGLASSDPRSLAQFTSRYVNRRLGIYLDGKLISNSVLTSPMSESTLLWGPNFSDQQLLLIVAVIQSGPLPAHVKLVASSAISPTQKMLSPPLSSQLAF